MTLGPLRRILLVEDDPDIQEVARMALEVVGGFVVQVCASGPEALRAAAEFAPDLAILDVMMPGMDGPRTLQELRKQESTATTPVVFMTAKVQSHEVAAYQRMGALDVVFKPFDPMTLATTLRQIWERRHVP